MWAKKITASIFILNILFLSFALAGGRRMGEMPAPRLLVPGDIVDLSGQNQVEFRWGTEGDRSGFDHYDFRLYRGPQTYEKDLILQKDVPSGATSIFLESSLFKPGQIYSWSLRFMGSKKSMSSYSVFKIK